MVPGQGVGVGGGVENFLKGRLFAKNLTHRKRTSLLNSLGMGSRGGNFNNTQEHPSGDRVPSSWYRLQIWISDSWF